MLMSKSIRAGCVTNKQHISMLPYWMSSSSFQPAVVLCKTNVVVLFIMNIVWHLEMCVDFDNFTVCAGRLVPVFWL